MSDERGIHVATCGSYSILRPVGRLGLGEVDQFAETLRSITSRENPRLVVDFEDVTFINSSSLGLLLEARSEIQKRDGRMMLAKLPTEVSRIFEMAHLDQLFSIVDDIEQAIQEDGA